MTITPEQLKALRDATGISVMQCKKALEEAQGDMDKAIVILRKKGGDAAAKKGDRALGAGAIGAYVHSTYEVAAMVVLCSETDFVSKNQEFIALAREIAMHVAAANPLYVTRDQVPAADLARTREVLSKEVVGKPVDMQEKILGGKLDSYFKEQVLMEQAYIKDPERTVSDVINDAILKFGEKIVVGEIRRITVK